MNVNKTKYKLLTITIMPILIQMFVLMLILMQILVLMLISKLI